VPLWESNPHLAPGRSAFPPSTGSSSFREERRKHLRGEQRTRNAHGCPCPLFSKQVRRPGRFTLQSWSQGESNPYISGASRAHSLCAMAPIRSVVDPRGIEPRFQHCERCVLPLYDEPLVETVGLEPTMSGRPSELHLLRFVPHLDPACLVPIRGPTGNRTRVFALPARHLPSGRWAHYLSKFLSILQFAQSSS
jgi:hypothetical protein